MQLSECERRRYESQVSHLQEQLARMSRENVLLKEGYERAMAMVETLYDKLNQQKKRDAEILAGFQSQLEDNSTAMGQDHSLDPVVVVGEGEVEGRAMEDQFEEAQAEAIRPWGKYGENFRKSDVHVHDM
jgi:predicted nuclease with TOPRIM domain